jgi:hypothetical protein
MMMKRREPDRAEVTTAERRRREVEDIRTTEELEEMSPSQNECTRCSSGM